MFVLCEIADLKLNVPPSRPRTIQNEEGGGGEDVQWKHPSLVFFRSLPLILFAVSRFFNSTLFHFG